MLSNQKDLEQERVECVFGLGGGELHTHLPDFPDWPHCRYWYEGAPEYADLPDEGEYRTICLEDMPYGAVDRLTPCGWALVETYAHSGEAECWRCGPGTGNEEQREGCQLCEGDGYVYLGSACEVVYRQDDEIVAVSYEGIKEYV